MLWLAVHPAALHRLSLDISSDSLLAFEHGRHRRNQRGPLERIHIVLGTENDE